MQELLTKKEKEEIESLKVGFNIIKESEEPMIQAANRVEISRKWSRKLLRLSFYFNIISIICFLVAGVLVLLKPIPSFYASTPSGKIVGPLPKVQLK